MHSIAIDILEVYGTERIWMNSACDWGNSVPLAVPKAMQEMKRRVKRFVCGSGCVPESDFIHEPAAFFEAGRRLNFSQAP